MKWTLLAGLLGSTASVLASLPTINITGNAFFDSASGERFYIRGVDYQPGGSSNLTDPLADETICTRDIEYFKELGLNTIRVYTIDNSLDHDVCMKALDEAGIYLILDVNTPDASISRHDAACSYNADYLQNVFATIDAFAEYDNVLGFFAGNEVINTVNTTDTATYVKATVRDMKKYLAARSYRQIPVGYSAADVSSNRLLAAEYFNCGNDSDARIDMFAVNDYSWCGHSSYVVSGYAEKVKMYNDYSLPIFLSEFGCNTVGTSRPFTEIGSIYSQSMSGVFSGGLVYEYSNEDNNYGLVQISENGTVETLTDFSNLKAQLNQTSNPTGTGGYSTTNEISECPDFEEGIWEADNTLPEMPSAASIFFTSGAGAPLGTGYDTQLLCYDNNNALSSSSSSSSSPSSLTSSADTSSSSSSNSPSATGSSAASSSKSKSSGESISVPSFYNVIYSMSDCSFTSIVVGFLMISIIAAMA